MAGLTILSCVVVDAPIGADEILGIQMVENALREDLKPIEQANAYRRLLDAGGWSARQLAAELSIHHAQVVRALAMLDLPAEVQDRVEQGGVSPAAAYEVSKLEDPSAQAELAQVAIRREADRPGRGRGALPGRDCRGGQAGREQAEDGGFEGQGARPGK